MATKENKAAKKRRELRDQYWPEANERVWDRHSETGFTTVPRLLGLVMVLIQKLSRGKDPASVYLDLWLRAFDDAFVQIIDEETLAYASGYEGNRATRTWKERMFVLQELGFIEVKPKGNREFGYIFIPNPLYICVRLKSEGKVPDDWWNEFLSRASEIGAELPELTATTSSQPA